MIKNILSKILRNLRLLYYTDRINFNIQKLRNKKQNEQFKIANPEVALPPDYLIYESFQINYSKYYTDSIESAKWLKLYFQKHIDLNNKRILDWGCGPGRIIRHMPDVIGNGCEYYGTDYNTKSIDWCSTHLNGIHFNSNKLSADLPYSDNYFDIIYGISIFTHLSEQMHIDWSKELYRILKPDGILFLTTHGDNCKIKLTKTELIQFENNKLVTRGKVKEGHRTYTAYQPKVFMRQLFNKMTVLEHVETKPGNSKIIPQDCWIFKK